MGAAAILARTATRLKEAQFIDVVGSARRVVESDLVLWDAHFTVDDASLLSAEQRARLAALDQLVPGDFAAVKRQVDILATAFEPDEFLAQLESEHRVKPAVRQRRGIGFTP